MILIRFIEYLRARSSILAKLGVALLVALVLLDALPFVVDKSAAHTQAERLPGFWAVFGLLGCLLLIVGAKGLGKAGLQRVDELSQFPERPPARPPRRGGPTFGLNKKEGSFDD